MNTAILRLTLSAAALATVLAAAGCASPAPDSATNNPETPAAEETAEAAVETACPDGFIEAYEAASLTNFPNGATFTEVSAADFTPDFLVPFLDGGCAVHVVGTAAFNGMELPVDDNYGFTTEDVAADIAAVLEEEGFVDQNGDGINFLRDDPYGYAQVVSPTDDFHTTGDAAVQQYYKGGTVFNAGE